MNREELRRTLLDAAWPLLAWAAVGLLARAVGYDSPLYLRVSAALGVFVLPGWVLSRFFLRPGTQGGAGGPGTQGGACGRGEGLLLRLLLAHGLALTWLGLSVVACQLLGVGFRAWYLLHGACCLGTLLFAVARGEQAPLPDHGQELRAARGAPGSLLLGVAAVVLLAAYFRAPTSVDLEVMAPQMVEHQRRHDFAWVAPGGAAFGLEGVMPRLRSHLLHVSLALLADASATNAVAVATYGATVHVGLLVFLALWGWTRALAGPTAPGWAAALAPLVPLTVAYVPGEGYQAYELHHTLLNGATIDKAFALLFLYPWLLVSGLRWLETGRRREAALLLLAAPLTFLVHPLTPHYFFLGVLALTLGARDLPRARRLALAVGAALLVAVIGLLQRGGTGELAIEALVRRDLATRAWHHYWPGHYAGCGLPSQTIEWVGGRMLLRPALYLGPYVLSSAACTLAWAVWRRRSGGRGPEEGRALGVQVAALALLPAVWCGAALLLQLAPHVWRGVERLHWFYLGLPAYALLLARVAGWLEARAASRPGLRLWPAALIAGYLGLQVPWLLRGQEFMHRDGTRAAPWPWFLELAHSFPRTAAAPFAWQRTEEAGLGERLWDPPAWLRPEDRVYLHTGSDWVESPRGMGWQLTIDRFALIPHLVHYPELGHEAWAFQRQGPAFLAGYDAFHDGMDGRVSGRLVRWLERERVSVVVSLDRDFVARLARALGRRARQLDPDTWRLE